MKITTTLLCFIALTIECTFAQINVVPMPAQVIVGNGYFTLKNSINIVYEADSLEFEANCLSHTLIRLHKEVVVSYGKSKQKATVRLAIDSTIQGKEEYRLDVTNKGILITGATKEGVFRGVSTLQQLVINNPYQIQHVRISDKPRFEYRSLMLDPARHFIPVADIKKYIDQMARFKFNYLHLHLSDDQGWRVEIKKYPLLTQIGSHRAETDGNKHPHSGFYTQDELRDIVAYAKKLHIEIIPEIDVPGHSVAAIVAYPHLTCKDTILSVRTTAGVSTDLLCAGNEEVFKMYGDIYNELCDIFPSKYFHMGGDEAPLDNWVSCPKCQAVKQKMNYTTNQELMSYFFERLSNVLTQKGKTPLFWYELDVPNYPKNTITYAWRMGLTPSVIERSRELGYKVICAPGEHAYFDYPHKKGDHPVINWGMPLLPLKKVYDFDPGYGLAKELQSHIMGVEATLWGECIVDIDRAFYMTYPRAIALAEAGWSNIEVRNWDSFIERAKPSMVDMISQGVNVRVPYEDLKN